MTLTLIQKLLTAIVVLTSIYATLIFAVYHDLIRSISKSLFNLLPSFIIFGLGIAISIVLTKPEMLFAKIFPLKSGFAKGILSSTVLPLVSASIRTVTTSGAWQHSLIKCGFIGKADDYFYSFV